MMLMMSVLMAHMMCLMVGVCGVMAVRLVTVRAGCTGEQNQGRRHQRRRKPFDRHVISFQ